MFMTFKFDSDEVANALVNASKRGIKVSVMLDNRSKQYAGLGGFC